MAAQQEWHYLFDIKNGTLPDVTEDNRAPMWRFFMRPAGPVSVAHLLAPLLEALLALLVELPAGDWARPTVCGDWRVHDVVAHLLGGDLGLLSRSRDAGGRQPGVRPSRAELVRQVNERNAAWVRACRHLSPRVLIELLALTGRQVTDYLAARDPLAPGPAVSWAGLDPAPNWLDTAREYTERWHHQQHIRDAVDRPGLTEARFLEPVLATFMWALPRAYAGCPAEAGATVTVAAGAGPSCWTIQRRAGGWRLYDGAPDAPTTRLSLPADALWRSFTRGLAPARVREQTTVTGDPALAEPLFHAVAIIA